MNGETNLRKVKVRAVCVNLEHLWRFRCVSMVVEGRVYNASVRAVLLHACET